MARSDSSKTTTELAPQAGESTGKGDTATKPANNPATDSPVAAGKSTETAAPLDTRAADISAREKALADRERELARREEALKHREETLSEIEDGTPPVEDDEDEDAVLLLNNSARVIAAADGTLLGPTAVTPISKSAYRRWFGRNGKPVPGIANYFTGQHGKPPDIQEVSLRNLAALPETHAVNAVNASTDASTLAKHAEVETREPVRSAITRRLKALKGKR